MTTYLVRRLFGSVPLLLLISIISYGMMRIAPGGPATVLIQPGKLSPAVRKHLIELMGLDKPWYIQYFYWLKTLVLQGSLGYSYVNNRPVVDNILEKLPVTLEIVGLSLLLTLLIAIPAGVIAATHRNGWFDIGSSTVAFLAYGIPVFWLGILLIDFFAIHLRWFPASGTSSVGHEHDLFDLLRHLVLPVVTLTVVSLASWLRYQRGAMIEALGAPFINTARAKGLPEALVIYKHALRNALLPTITLLGLSLPGLVGGAYFVEYVFSMPGMGYLGINSVFARDYPVVMGLTMLSALFVVVGNLLADIGYAFADPRVRYE